MPSIVRFTRNIAEPIPPRQWIPRYRISIYFLIVGFTGLFFLLIALFVSPNVWVEVGTTGSSTYYITVIQTIFYTPLPVFVNILIGLTSIILIPLIEPNSGRQRLKGATIFAGLFAVAFFIEHIQIGILTDTAWQAYGLPPYFTPWITTPVLFLLMAAIVIVGIGFGSIILCLGIGFLGDYLGATLKGPIQFSGLRRTAVIIKGFDRATVLSIDQETRRTPVFAKGDWAVYSVNHKGGYFRGFARPSKWQAYDRED